VGAEPEHVESAPVEQVATFRDAIAQTGWPALPDPLGGDP
jgi:hypothetical protein